LANVGFGYDLTAADKAMIRTLAAARDAAEARAANSLDREAEAHRRGYAQGTSAGETLRAAMADEIKRLEAELAAARAIYTPGPRQATAEYPATAPEAVARTAAMKECQEIAMLALTGDADGRDIYEMIPQIIAQAGKGAGE